MPLALAGQGEGLENVPLGGMHGREATLRLLNPLWVRGSQERAGSFGPRGALREVEQAEQALLPSGPPLQASRQLLPCL